MNLVQSTFLGGLAALAIPVIVHLLFRFRTRRVSLGTIRFLGELIKKNAQRKRIKRYVLLAMRMAALAILVLLFARPYLIAQGIGKAERLVTILIDASATMTLQRDGRPLVAWSVAEVQNIIASSGRGTRFEVAVFDHEIRPLGAQGDGSLEQALAGIDTSSPGYQGTNYAAALAWARDITTRSTSARKELLIFTDFQRSGLEWAGIEPLPDDVEVTLHNQGRDGVNNVAVIGADLAGTLVRPGDTIKVNATIANFGPFTQSNIAMKLYLQSERNNVSRRVRVTLLPGALETIEFELESLEPGFWRGFVEVEVDDELAFDNRRYVAVQVAPPWKVLIVDGQPHESAILSETHYLQAALRLAPPGKLFEGSPYEPKVISASDGLPPDLSGYDLIILANVGDTEALEADALAKFVSAGGGLVVFTGENVTAERYKPLANVGLSPGKIGQPQFANDLPWRINEWETNHSILKLLSDPQHGDLRRIAFNAYTKIEPSDSAAVLATLRSGDPLLLETSLGKGRVLWLATACDRSWSDLPRGRLYLPIVHQMLGYLTGLNDGGPVRNKLLTAEDTSETKPGVYRRDQYWEVLNTNPRESDPDRCTMEDFVARFDLKEASSQRNSATRTLSVMGPSTEELRDDEVWHWLIFALMGVLGAEFFLANRTTA